MVVELKVDNLESNAHFILKYTFLILTESCWILGLIWSPIAQISGKNGNPQRAVWCGCGKSQLIIKTTPEAFPKNCIRGKQ